MRRAGSGLDRMVHEAREPHVRSVGDKAPCGPWTRRPGHLWPIDLRDPRCAVGPEAVLNSLVEGGARRLSSWYTPAPGPVADPDVERHAAAAGGAKRFGHGLRRQWNRWALVEVDPGQIHHGLPVVVDPNILTAVEMILGARQVPQPRRRRSEAPGKFSRVKPIGIVAAVEGAVKVKQEEAGALRHGPHRAAGPKTAQARCMSAL
jgi:hypothetical protein